MQTLRNPRNKLWHIRVRLLKHSPLRRNSIFGPAGASGERKHVAEYMYTYIHTYMHSYIHTDIIYCVYSVYIYIYTYTPISRRWLFIIMIMTYCVCFYGRSRVRGVSGAQHFCLRHETVADRFCKSVLSETVPA